MKRVILVLSLIMPDSLPAQTDSILSGIYFWKQPPVESKSAIFSAILFEGKTYAMEWLQMSANTIFSSGRKKVQSVPADEECLIIIKSGKLSVSIKDSAWVIGPGSVALLMPAEKYSLQTNGKEECNFYEMKYRSKKPVNTGREGACGGSAVKDWRTIEFRPHDKGGIRNFFERPTAMCKRLEMHATTLKEGIRSHDPHSHRAEEIVLVTDNKTEMEIAGKFYKGDSGSIYYLGSNISHAIQNDGIGTCTYFAFQFE